MTVKEKIKSRSVMKDGILTPVRTEKELAEAKKSRTILDQEYNGVAVGEYSTIKITDLNTAATGDEKAEDLVDVNTIRHTDIIKISGIEHNVVALKTTSEVLETIPDGKYQSMSLEVKFTKTEAECLEGQIKGFLPPPMNLPKSRKALNVRGDFIIVEPSINGFKISILAEELSDDSYDKIVKIAEAIDRMQAYYLCKTVKSLAENGIPVEDLIKSQAAVGVVPTARRAFERNMAEEASTDGKILITSEIRDKSARFADKLNEDLQLAPLTRSSFMIGIQVFTIEVSTNPKKKATWLSSRSNLSYFKKGVSQGRIERLVGNKRTIPLMTEDVPEVAKACEGMVNATLPVFENAVRSQLGIDLLKDKYEIPDYEPEALSIVDLFNYDPVQARKIATKVATIANKAVKEAAKADRTKSIATVLGSYLNQLQVNKPSGDDSED